MLTANMYHTGWRSARATMGYLAVAMTPLVISGCSDLLTVDLPGAVEEETVADASFAELFTMSSVAAFECAATNYGLISGNVSDEFLSSGSLEAFLHYDARTFGPDYTSLASGSCSGTGGLYTPLSQARWLADDALRRLDEATDTEVPNRTRLMAIASAYAGYSYTLLGEGFCSAAFDAGPEMQPAEVLALAEARFTNAINHAESVGDGNLENLARVGLARVRLNRGDLVGAAVEAEKVPEGFVWWVAREAGDAARENRINSFNHQGRHTSVHPDFWDLEWKGVSDPRVSLTHTGILAFDGLSPFVTANKHATAGTNVRLASWEEAQLILGEARGGQVALDVVNRLHAQAGLPPFDPGDGDPVQHIIHEERRRELFAEGHRMNDILRHDDLSFHQGQHPFGGRPYGSATCFPLPDVERNNNPSLGG